jgi:hypothetical protein
MIPEQNMKQSTWKNRYILGASGAENSASIASALTASKVNLPSVVNPKETIAKQRML